MIDVTHNYTVAAKEHRPEIVWSVWTTPRGRYLWSNVFPSDDMVNFFGSVNLWNGLDQTLGDGQAWGDTPVCEYGQRILNPGSVTTSLVPQQGRLLVSLGQSERGAVSIEYNNTDHFFSNLFSEERNEAFLLQRHDLYHGFLGLDPDDFVKLPTMEITQMRYTKKRLIVVSEMQTSVYTPETYADTLTAYALYYDADVNGNMAYKDFTQAELATVFFSTDDWSFNCNCNVKESTTFTPGGGADPGLLYLENKGTNATVLRIGFEGGYLVVITGQDVEGTPSTTTYTDTVQFTSADLNVPLNIQIKYSHTDSEITFIVNGVARTQSATQPYDRTGTNNIYLTIGLDFEGYILNTKFREIWFCTNNQGDNSLSEIPDVISGVDVDVFDASWGEWP